MIEARIRKRFAAGRESAAFFLDLDFETAAGVTVLFGPSGSGKTLTLDCIAGLVRPDEGRICVSGQVLFDSGMRRNLPARERRCGYVFQNYALFPHMTLRENLEFAAAGRPKDERVQRVGEMLERFRLTGEAGRKPHEVSGGQKQRCSIARALIGEPAVLLLDEPARGLDAPLRSELYDVLRRVNSEFGTPLILVTHDLEESLELGESMLVVSDGRLVQSGRPPQVVANPANLEVARLFGSYNLLPAQIRALDPAGDASIVSFEGVDLSGPYLHGHNVGDLVTLYVRPGSLRAFPGEAFTGPNQMSAELVRVVDTPYGMRLQFDKGLTVDVARGAFHPGVRSWVVEFPPAAMRVF